VLGSSADLAVLDAPSYVHLAYRPGTPLVVGTWIAGELGWEMPGTIDA
jgi:imidazolonepropionase